MFVEQNTRSTLLRFVLSFGLLIVTALLGSLVVWSLVCGLDEFSLQIDQQLKVYSIIGPKSAANDRNK